MDEQRKKLMQTLAVAVDGLTSLPQLIPVLQQLGVRHAGYMVQDAHYDTVGAALLWTLKEGLGDDFNEQVETAWTAVYTTIADVMKKAAATAARPSRLPPRPAARRPKLTAKPPKPKTAALADRGSPDAESTTMWQREKLEQAVAKNLQEKDRSDAPPPGAATVVDGPFPASTIELVQRSWSKVLPISDVASKLFYDRLFEQNPALRSLFKSSMVEQRKKLMQTLSVAVDGLSNTSKLIPVLQDLGVRHAGYMVENGHYDDVGAALLWTLKEGLGDDFNDELKHAWSDVYATIADIMKKAATNASHGATGDDESTMFFESSSRRQAKAKAKPKPAPAKATAAKARPSDQGNIKQSSATPEAATAKKDDGPFDAATIRLVQASWAKVMPISDVASQLFYDRLFELDPNLRPLFKSDMAEQRKKLMQTLAVAVDGLSDVQRLLPVLQQLGVRHVGYMVQDVHYDTVGAALLWTLEEGLGEDFDDAVQNAWTHVYDVIASVMKEAAAKVDNMPMERGTAAAQAKDASPVVTAKSKTTAPPTATDNRQGAATDTPANGPVPDALILANDKPLRVQLEADKPIALKVALEVDSEALVEALKAGQRQPIEARGSRGPSSVVLVVLSALTASSLTAYGLLQIPAVALAFDKAVGPAAAATLACCAALSGYLLGRRR